MNFHNKSISETFNELNTTEKGLTEKEAKYRLEKYGENLLKNKKKNNLFLKFLCQFKDIMVIILLISAVISFVFAVISKSSTELIDALIIFGIVLVNATLGFSQEIKAENALETLKQMSQPYSKVLRQSDKNNPDENSQDKNGQDKFNQSKIKPNENNQSKNTKNKECFLNENSENKIFLHEGQSEEKRIKTSDLVVGDIVLLEAGDVVPADLLLIESSSLKCDESRLTGESLPVNKEANIILPEKTNLADRKNMCFSSTTVVYGRGKGVVVATGQNAEMGKIASMLTGQKKENTPLQKSLNKLGEIITFIVLAVAIIIFLVNIFITKEHWVQSFLTAVAIGVAAIPESLPAVVTIILSIGVMKLAKKNTIIKKLHAVETLGCCQIICSDKTGTITQNKMTVRAVYVGNTFYENSFNLNLKVNTHEHLLKCMTLCNDAKKQKDSFLGDPTEIALVQFAEKLKVNKQSLEKEFPRINEIPFDSNRKLMSTLHLEKGKKIQYTKGAVDELLSCCTQILDEHGIRKITLNDIENIKAQNKNMCINAQRVLAYAYKICSYDGATHSNSNDKKEETNYNGNTKINSYLKSSTDLESRVNISLNSSYFKENDLIFIGLTGMIDPPREEVFEALIKCKQAGMKAVMITGDHKDTAYAIAKELNMVKSEKEVVNGSFLDKFSDTELKDEIKKYSVFTRVTPEHKVRIVKAFQENGKVVAMTGDGVNDAPSIKCADIGIGMGNTGTDVTKEVADIILTDDNFATIVLAVEEGRKVFGNIQKTIQFLLGCNIAEVLSIFAITLFFPKFILFSAVQILFINLVTDTFPSIALGVNEAEKDIMKVPPREKKYIIGGRVGFDIIYQGIVQALCVMVSFVIGIYVYCSPVVASTMAFLTINLIQMFHMYNVKTSKSIFASNPFKNKFINFAFLFGLTTMLLITLVPALSSLFGLINLTLEQWAITLLLSFIIIPICEIVKFLFENKK